MSKKSMRCMVLVLLMSLVFSMDVHGAELPKSKPLEKGSVQITVWGEKTCWYYRVYKGVKQKRLWSITYKRWKTNWINM